jgi:K+:H+ antiporter
MGRGHPSGSVADVAQLLLPLLVIVGGAALFRFAFQRARQPAVLGELILGILLGASLLGWAWPQAEAVLFAKEAMPPLQALGWIGLALFMFSVGTEMRWHGGDARATVKLAAGALLLPFSLGVLLALTQPSWFFDGLATPQHLALVAVVMCVSALPVLARILEHQGLLHARLGALILGAGTVDDLFAWTVLALVIGAAGVGLTGDFLLNVGIVAAALAAAYGASRLLGRVMATRKDEPGNGTLAVLVCAILGSSWLTQAAGLHALVGPLAVGAIVARQPHLQAFARGKLQGLTMVLFLPTFFVLAGLDTNLTLLASSTGAVALVAVLLAASLGKVVGCLIGGRAAGLTREESVTAGLLLNARGAVDLVVAKIGLDAGLLAPRGFALLVLVIVITTCAAAPALTAFQAWSARRSPSPRPRGVPTAAEALAMTVRAEEAAAEAPSRPSVPLSARPPPSR